VVIGTEAEVLVTYAEPREDDENGDEDDGE